jgi:hypothetical protein
MISSIQNALQSLIARRHDPTPLRAWGLLGLLWAYQVLVYTTILRIYLNVAVVLMPWLLNQPGYRLYDNVILQHAPGTMWLGAALYPLLPDPQIRIQVMMALVSGGSLLGIFLLGRRLWGWPFGLLAACFYGAWGPVMTDRPMYFEVTIGLLTLWAIFTWSRADSPRWKAFVAGILVGLAILFKQHALAVAIVFVIWRVLALDLRRAVPDSLIFLLGTAIPVGGTLGTLALQGRLAATLFWTWTFNFQASFEARLPAGEEWPILALWLWMAGIYALFVIPRRESWRSEGTLLLGLIPATMAPAILRYGRFHLSAAVQIVALASTGGVYHLLIWLAESGRSQRLQAISLGALGIGAAALALGCALPPYYQVKLGPRLSEYSELIPVAEALAEEFDAEPGTRIWVIPEFDPTDNLYAVGGYLPPTYWVQSYDWYLAVPGVKERMLGSLRESPPKYALVFERWASEIPPLYQVRLDTHYLLVGDAEAGGDYGRVSVYRYALQSEE